MAEQAGGGVDMDSLGRPTFASPQRYERWIRPLKTMDQKQMPHELACFATRYLVEEAVARGMSVDNLLLDLPRWLTLDHLVKTSSQVSHGVFIALAERLKEYVGNPDPWFIGEVARRAAAFDDPVTNIVRRWGTVSGAIKFTTFLGKFVTKDQHVDARETGTQKGRRTGRTIHYFLNGQAGTYFEQTTATVGYYESLTRLWPNITPQPELVTVEHRLSRFAPEQLLGDAYYYARNGMRFARDTEGKFRINGEVYAEPVDVNNLQAEWSFDTSKVKEPPRPVRMIRPWEHDGKVLIPEGLILDAPASVYVWSYDRLPPVNLFQAVIEGMRQRFGGRKYINEVIGQVEAQRDRAEEQLGEANLQRAEAERQRKIAETRRAELEQLVRGIAHEHRNNLARVQARAMVLGDYLKKTGAPEERRDDATLIALEAKISLETSEALRELYTPGERLTERVNLTDVVSEYGTLFANDPKHSRLDIEFEPSGEYFVEVIKGTAYSVVANLMTNAAVAMGYGKVGTKLRVELAPEMRGGITGTVLSVSDEGRGMDEETIRKYKAGLLFANSEEGKGTGHRIITQFSRAHNQGNDDGGLTIKSEPGKGTRIDLFIPREYQR